MSKKYVYLFSEGNANMRELLGGKGANLAEMTNIGLPGQTFELIELSDDEGCVLCLYMTDNKNTNKNRVTFYDSEVPVVYHIYSPFFTNPSEYSKAIDACKEFLTKSMNYIYLADIKDICDIAPCCELVIYKVFQDDKGR